MFHIKYCIFVFLLTWSSITTIPVPDDPPADPAAPAADAAPGAPAGPAPDAAAAGGDTTTPAAAGDAAGGSDKPGGGDATTPDGGAKDGEAEQAMLTFGPDETTPENVYTNHYGDPISTREILNITLLRGPPLAIFTDIWETFYCLCITRGPLPRFKLYGNIHFPKIKVTPERYVTPPTEETTTICPPCECPTCPPFSIVGSREVLHRSY